MRTWVSGIALPHLLNPDVVAERERQVTKWGIQHHGPEWWSAILVEEVGEFAQGMLDLHAVVLADGEADSIDAAYAHMREELVQCAAVCLSALADLDGRYRPGTYTPFPAVDEVSDPARWWDQNGQRTDCAATRDIGPFDVDL